MIVDLYPSSDVLLRDPERPEPKPKGPVREPKVPPAPRRDPLPREPPRGDPRPAPPEIEDPPAPGHERDRPVRARTSCTMDTLGWRTRCSAAP